MAAAEPREPIPPEPLRMAQPGPEGSPDYRQTAAHPPPKVGWRTAGAVPSHPSCLPTRAPPRLCTALVLGGTFQTHRRISELTVWCVAA
ncbi:hypothetical protein E2C01_047336 [Portunus trituberculatus]|uniref:Uncharacterized protein n=1 Tax=Portunus trituberculatus TaxID=210409 RepID=A0A5B7G7N7_PORTR|nr:hypothetical protein [Portunus trituberculatus]